MTHSLKPLPTNAECDAIMSAPGALLELEHVLIDGRIQRVYKKLWPSLRNFYLWASATYSTRLCIVFETERLTYQEVFNQASRAASIFRDVYGVRKGDRVVISMRNFPEWIISFWACHLLGAVAVAVNAWLPSDQFRFCISNADPKVIVVDVERAATTERLITEVDSQTRATGALVVRSHEAPGKRKWKGLRAWEEVMKSYSGPDDAWKKEPECFPDENATIFFTSGTTGLPKGALSTQRAVLTNIFSAVGGRMRYLLRKGEEIPPMNLGAPAKVVIVPVPLFHVTGCMAIMMPAIFTGSRTVLIRKWEPHKVAQLIRDEQITAVTGVPSLILDLLETSVVGFPSLENIGSGGAAANENIAKAVEKSFPNAVPAQGYGLTETSGGVAGFTGEDYVKRPMSTGVATIVNDLLIMDSETGRSLPSGEVGELWVRGPNVFKQYWRDPRETEKVLTKDGWLKTGDLAYIDEEGFLYIKDRVKDIIIRGGENIASIAVENALFADTRILDCAVVGIPDRRLGELVAAVAIPKSSYSGKVLPEELMEIVRQRLPAFAVPVMVIVRDEPLARNAAGKVIKTDLRKVLQKEWERRKQAESKSKSKAKAKL